MRLENYYTLITKQMGLTRIDNYNKLDEILNNIPIDDKEELNEFDEIEILHNTEYYDGTFEEKTLYKWENGKVETLDEEITEKLKEQNSLTQTKEIKFDYDEAEDGQTIEFVIIDNKKYIDLEYCKNKIDELQGQFDYECGCNKELVATQDKNERLKILLANALTILEENGFGGQSFCKDELGMTEEEYKEIMGDNE